ncbi:MAG: SCO family protein [Casimicrobiaceae bacterium]
MFDSGSSPRSMADYRGKVVMLFFGYTDCTDACPITLAKMAQAVDQLGPERQGVQGIFVTLDPVRDTPAVLTKYATAFHPAVVGLFADEAATANTARDFKVFYAAQKADASGFYTVDHSSGIFVFDGQWRLRLFMGPNIWLDAMVHDLKLLLRHVQMRRGSEESANRHLATS